MKCRIFVSWMIAMLMIITATSSVLGQEATTSSSRTESISVSSNDKTTRWRTSNGLNDFNIESRGRIELTDDDKDIKSISDDGYLEINKTTFGSRRTIVIESLGGGKMKKEYYEGRTKMEWDPAGKSWMSEILPEIVRSTTIGAESRVARFYSKGGTNAVLNEIGQMESDYVKSHYANLLMKQNVPVKDYTVIVNKLANELGSDHYLSEFLRGSLTKFMQNKEATSAFFAATSKLESDHYKTVVIKDALKNQIASLDNVKLILQAASNMDSDHYITEVLTTLLNQDNLTDALVAEMINTTKSIESDHYKTVVLTKALDQQGLSNNSFQKVIESVKDIDSDHYITQVINHLLQNKLTDPMLTLLLDITNSIESSHYRSEVLKTLLKRQEITDEQFNKLVYAVGQMDSDHYKMTVLTEAMMSKNITEAKVINIINSTKDIDSDHYITEVLVAAAPKVKNGSQALKDAYRAAAKRISSETYYGRALRAMEE